MRQRGAQRRASQDHQRLRAVRSRRRSRRQRRGEPRRQRGDDGSAQTRNFDFGICRSPRSRRPTLPALGGSLRGPLSLAAPGTRLWRDASRRRGVCTYQLRLHLLDPDRGGRATQRPRSCSRPTAPDRRAAVHDRRRDPGVLRRDRADRAPSTSRTRAWSPRRRRWSRRSTCCATRRATPARSPRTGEDYEGCLVRVVDVQDRSPSTTAGTELLRRRTVSEQSGHDPDRQQRQPATFDPRKNQYVNVTGVLDLSFGTWRIQPRDNADITVNPDAWAWTSELPAECQLRDRTQPGARVAGHLRTAETGSGPDRRLRPRRAAGGPCWPTASIPPARTRWTGTAATARATRSGRACTSTGSRSATQTYNARGILIN